MEASTCAAVATSSFYPKPSIRDVRRQSKLSCKEHELKIHTIAPEYRLRFDSPSGVWRVFHRQKDALDLAQAQPHQDVHVFAFESESFTTRNGQRLYLVCSYDKFWHYYSHLPLKQRHHYEVIPQDAVCRLYLDLEFEYEYNENKNGAHMTSVYLKYICAWLHRIFNIKCSVEDVLLLDASTDRKFSQHAVFHLRGSAFRNNSAVGCFIRHIHSKLLSLIGRHASTTRDQAEDVNEDELAWLTSVGICVDDLADLTVKHRNGSSTFLYDLGVYSRNRNFRLLGSTKLGKQAGELVAAAENRFKIPHFSGDEVLTFLKNPRLFFDSLICSIRYTDEISILDFEESSAQCTLTTNQPSICSADTEGYGRSSYPALDIYITSFVQGYGGVGRGRIWRWACFNRGGCVLVYDIIRNRWCANVGREHRSNNIFIVVDLRRGVFYQKCHDPDCRASNFKSQDHLLPPDLLETDPDISAAMDVDNVADEELVRAAIAMENSIADDCVASIDEGASDDDLVRAAIMAEHSDVMAGSG